MAEKRCTQHRNNIILILIYIFFLCLALGAGLVALFTDNWVTYEVKENRTAVYNASADTSMLYHTRSRGLFWIVIKDQNVKLVRDRDNNPRFAVQYNYNNTCGLNVSAGFWDLSRIFATIYVGTNFLYSIGLEIFKINCCPFIFGHELMMKSSVSLHLVYLVIVALCAWISGFALIFGIVNLKISVIILVLGEVAGIIGMVLFHYYLNFEKSNDVPEMANTAYYFWNEYLKTNTTEKFSYSFMLQWISIGIGLITVLLGIIFILTWTVPKPKQPKSAVMTYMNAHDNHAYDKEDFQRTNPRTNEYRPSPRPERRELPVAQNPIRRPYANGPDFDDTRRRPVEDTRYDYREAVRDFGPRQQYPQTDQSFYPRF